MVSKKVTVTNPTGLHLRPAGNLCKEAMKYKSMITFQFRDTTANAKSVLSVLGACVISPYAVTLFFIPQDVSNQMMEAENLSEDEQEALDALTAAVESGLGEQN